MDPLDALQNATLLSCKNTGNGVNWVGLGALIVFYIAVLLVGMWAGWKNKKKEQNQEQVMLAGRDIGLFVGLMTMGATWVDGGFINGSAQETYDAGLVWVQAPFGYASALLISGTFYARKMRNAEYVTMIDPFTIKYGKWGALQALPAAVSEIFWSASILGALGSTLQVILNLDETVSIIVSAVVALLYTLLGGLISVAYTDVVQLIFIFIGMFVGLPFALNHEAVGDIYEEKTPNTTSPAWYGEILPHERGLWIDYTFLVIFGGIPWQSYFQRVLSSKTAARAQYLSYAGSAIALVMIAPSVIFGAIARNTDWTLTDYNCPAPTEENSKIVLPLCFQYLTPPAVAFFGLGSISAAVMSSTDSSMLSASTMLARNVYQKVFRPRCSEREVIYALWALICFNCTVATVLAIEYKSIYELFVLCGDFMFVIVFPQLTLLLYWDQANTYGSVISFLLSLVLRLLCGDALLGLPATISFGTLYGAEGSCPEAANEWGACEGIVPFRTIVTTIGTLTHIILSFGTHQLFTKKLLSIRYDFLGVFREDSRGEIVPSSTRFSRQTGSVQKLSNSVGGKENEAYAEDESQ